MKARDIVYRVHLCDREGGSLCGKLATDYYAHTRLTKKLHRVTCWQCLMFIDRHRARMEDFDIEVQCPNGRNQGHRHLRPWPFNRCPACLVMPSRRVRPPGNPRPGVRRPASDLLPLEHLP